MKILIWFIFSSIGGCLGRLGGTSLGTKWRDIGLPCLLGAYLWLLGQIKGIFGLLGLIPSLLLMFPALTSYRYFLPKPKDYKWFHYSLHAFMVSLTILPFMFYTGHWIGAGIRLVVNTILVGVWSYFVSQVDLEEGGRYFIIIGSTPLLLI